MSRRLIGIAMAWTLFVPGMTMGQQSLPTSPPPDPHDVAPDQRLENVEQRLFVAAEQLKVAADAQDPQRADEALRYGQLTIRDVRGVFDELPEPRRIQYEEALLKAEQVLAKGDPRAAAEAMKALQQEIRTLTARGA